MKTYKFTSVPRRALSPDSNRTILPMITPKHARRLTMDSKAVAPSGKGYKLSAFRMMRTIGTGTFARVRLCRHKATDNVYVLKIMKKSVIIKKRQTEHIKNEQKLLQEVENPFLINLVTTFQDASRLYLLLDYVPGGELYSHLRNLKKFDVPAALFYAAEVTSAFEYLHSRNIIYRDLKPENALISREGHLKLCDFGFAKKLRTAERTFTVCGTPEYLPPEVITQTGYTHSADWWTLGIFIYEMLAGQPPFSDENPHLIYKQILSSELEFPCFFNKDACDLIFGLLAKDPRQRFTLEQVKGHKFFDGVDWKAVEELKLKPPIVPVLKSNEDSSYFDKYKEEKKH